MEHDRKITMAVAGSRKATHWQNQTLFWSELLDKLKIPTRSTETLGQYLKLPKSQQDELKDVGGFVAGELSGNRRKANAVKSRDILTLDLDNILAGGTPDVLKRLEGLECSYAIYSTRKHAESSPRLRVLVPLNRTCPVDEYEPLARKIASIIGIELADPTTFAAERLMYFPSCCSDSTYVFQFADKPFLDADGLLATYGDWRNVAEWAEVPGANEKQKRLADKQEDPTEKKGYIGAFCKLYDIHEAMEKFLPGVYAATDDGSGRYTFVGGSTAGGAVIYNDGLFLYSHHATDPCSGLLVNAFDLVRLHKFGEQDDEAKAGTPVNKLPSFLAMANLARNDEAVREQSIDDDFGNREGFKGQDKTWMKELDFKPNGQGWKANAKNLEVIFTHDPNLKGKYARDTFSGNDLLLSSIPWKTINKPQIIEDDDDKGLRDYLNKTYGIASPGIITDSFGVMMMKKAFHPIKEYFKTLEWDGIKRLETLLVDYLGAEDTPLNRATTRLTLSAAVARIYEPGVKFDYVLTLVGPQGIGKSSLIALIGGDWYTDSLSNVGSKDSYEQLQGSWIIELGELAALRKADLETIKVFVTSTKDKFRSAYARRAKVYPRQCIFIASTNDDEPLKDQTGNRRFWPVKVGVNSVDLEKRKAFPRDQIWAEALYSYKNVTHGKLCLSRELEEQAQDMQKSHTQESSLAGYIRERLDKPWGGGDFGNIAVKDRVCAMQIWAEMLGEERSKFTVAKAREINAVLQNTKGWKKHNSTLRFEEYGTQRGFVRM